MLQLLYTNAEQPEAEQENPSRSIGGYVSNTQLINGQVDNLFGSTSYERVLRRNVEYRLLAIRNLHTQPVDNIKITPTIENILQSKISIGVTEPFIDECDNRKFELLTNRFSRPVSVNEFTQLESGEEIQIPTTLQSGEVLGLWIERESKKQEVDTSCEILNEETSKGSLIDNSIMDLQIKIEYDLTT